MKRIRRNVMIAVVAMLLMIAAGCTPTPIQARTIEEIRGTYAVKEYYMDIDGKKTDLISVYEYLYIIVGENSVASIIYKRPSEDYVARELGYTLKYSSGSTTKINEIKLRFELPYLMGEVMYVNYLTVSQNNSLACVKAGYFYGEDGKKMHKSVYMSVKRVSSDVSYSYVEEDIGYELTDIQSPFN